MLKNNIFYSAVMVDDFKKRMSSTYVEGGSPSANQWSFIGIENTAIINSESGKAGMATFTLGLLFVGDVIEISTEFLNISGVKGKIGIDRRDVDGTFLGNTTIQSINSGYYEPLKTTFVVMLDGYYTVNFGLWSADVGLLKLRNPTVKVESANHPREKNVEDNLTLNEYLQVGHSKQFVPMVFTSETSANKLNIPIVSQSNMNVPHFISIRGVDGRSNSGTPNAFKVDISFASISSILRGTIVSSTDGVTLEVSGMNLVLTLPYSYTSLLVEFSSLTTKPHLINFEASTLIP